MKFVSFCIQHTQRDPCPARIVVRRIEQPDQQRVFALLQFDLELAGYKAIPKLHVGIGFLAVNAMMDRYLEDR